jgi:hypothetical protein
MIQTLSEITILDGYITYYLAERQCF